MEQFLYFTGARDAQVVNSQIANYNHPEHPGLDDYGDMTVVGNNGCTGFFRLDWFTPDGLSTWGNSRMFIQGTDGFIELRKYVDIGHSDEGDNVYMVNNSGTYRFNVAGKVGYPFFSQMILDSMNGTENAMTQDHILKASELAIKAELFARKLH